MLLIISGLNLYELEIFKNSHIKEILLGKPKSEKMGSCIDLRKYQNGMDIQDAYSKIVSGKKGYKAVIERKIIPPKCVKCGRGGDNDQKFCPQCGGEMKVPLTECPGCNSPLGDSEKFCTNCGKKVRD